MSEREQEQRLPESVANCHRKKTEIEQLQRMQQAVASGKEKKRTTTEPVFARSRPVSRMEIDEAPLARGCFKLDKNEGLEAWKPPEPVRSLRNLETNSIGPLMKISQPGFTPSSTSGPPPIPPFFAAKPFSDRLGGRTDSRESSRGSMSRQLGAPPMEGNEAELSDSQSSVVSSVVVVDNKKTERPERRAEPNI